MAGVFTGDCIVQFLPDGRRMQLVKPFGYTDAATLQWDVPAKAIIDGASIPRVLWSFVGGPFEGKYRAASVIHDWYCDRRSRAWRAVHRVFYEAMLTSGVDGLQAKIMYAAVHAGGPRWSDTVVANNSLEVAPDLGVFRNGSKLKLPAPIAPDVQRAAARLPLENEQFKALADQIRRENPDLDEIDVLADAAVQPGIDPHILASRNLM